MNDTDVLTIDTDRILIAKKRERKLKFTPRKNYLLTSDLRIIPKKMKKGAKRKPSCKIGKICGKNHHSLHPEKKEYWKMKVKLGGLRKDVFFMVDGVQLEELEMNAINTNSGVLTMDQLEHLQ